MRLKVNQIQIDTMIIYIKVYLPIITFGGDTNVLIRRKRTKIPTMTPVLLIRSISVIFTAFADRTRKITDILKQQNVICIPIPNFKP